MAVQEFLKKTQAGIEAFLASVTTATREPERLGAFIASDTAAVSKVAGWSRTEAVAEPLVPTLLGGTIARSERPTSEKAKVGLALAGNAVSRAGKSADHTQASVASTAGTVAHYAAYASVLSEDVGAKANTTGLVGRGLVVAAGAGLAALSNRKLVLPTLVGGAALAYATELANDPQVPARGNVHTEGLSHGANLLVASEAVTLLRGTVLKKATGWGGRLVDATALGLSTVGQTLLVDGILRR